MKHLYFIFISLTSSFIIAQPANDDCANAEIITISTSSATTINYDTTNANESTDASCEANVIFNDLWYSFNMPVDGNLRITNADLFDGITVYDACNGNEVACRFDNGFLYGFTSGTDYILRIANRSSNAANKSLNIIAVAPEANDECANANPLSVTTDTATTINYNTINATESTDASCEANVVFHDLWYSFTMPSDGNLRITNADLFDGITVYDACNGNEVACRFNNGFLYGFTEGTDYILRIANRSSSANDKSLNIIAVVPEANDECTNAIPLSITTDTATTINYNTINATESTDASCEANVVFHDLWYAFTMPVDGNLRITNADLFDGITIYDACDGNEVACRFNNGFLYNFTGGTDYILRIANRTSSVDNKSLNIIAVVPDANDECANAIPISMTTDTATTINYNTINATESTDALCEGNNVVFHDLWYSFTMPSDGNLRITDADLFDGITIYDACNGNEVACRFNNGFLYSFTGGTDYILRIANRSSNTDNKSLNIIAVVPESNDECVNATPITITTETATTINYNTINATESTDASCEGDVVFHDLWYSFTMPVDGNLRITNADLLDAITVYDACDGNEIACRFNNGLLETFNANTDYILRLANRSSNADNKSMDISIEGIVTNDVCNDAIELMVSDMSQDVIFQISGSEILNEEGCPADIQNFGDIWYSFTMPEDGAISINSALNSNQFALYDACDGNQLNCFTNAGDFTNLLSGNTYYLRVFRVESLVNTLLATQFSIVINNSLDISDIDFRKVKIYPIPAASIINIDTAELIKSLQLFNLHGQKIIELKNTNQMNVSHINSGIYMLKVDTQKSAITKRVIIN